ncbi:MAG: DUF2802 domain-containing protein [Azonexus sp.]
MDLGGVVLGMREAVIALISLVAIYMAFVLLRMRRLRNRRAEPPASPVMASTGDPGLPLDPEPPATSGRDTPLEDVWQSEPGRTADNSGEALAQEVSQLREELDAIRGELAALREDMLQEMAHVRATQSVSPIYGDAMQMAAAGYEPAMIAERCGIARAEAELVVALAKSKER